jgi:outer membrane receptor for ferric coprogen and ferric-rhodotorulic acid
MTPPWKTLTALVALALATTGAFAQTVPATTPPPTGTTRDDPITLSPFEVSDARDIGYASPTAMSGTRTNELLENLPNAISVLNQDFLQDIASNNFLDAVEYMPGAENIVNDQGTRGAPQNVRSGNQISFRGVQTFRQLRDGFVWYVPQDMFNTERIEVSRGPAGVAYGDVDTGGIINISTKRAHLRDAYSAQVRYDTFGTRRYSLDLNKQIVPKRLGFRLNAIERNDAGSARQRTNTEGDGIAGALRWDVTKDGRTRIDVTYEYGRQDAYYGHLTLNDQTAAYVRGTGTNALDANPNLAGVQANGVGMARVPTTGNVQGMVEIGGILYNLRPTATEAYRWSAVVTGAGVAGGADPQNPLRIPILPASGSLVKRGEDWGGPSAVAAGNWGAGVIDLQHTFTSNLSGSISYNRQRDVTNRSQTNNGAIFVGGQNARAILIDVNPRLPNPNGAGTIVNPNYEQLFTAYVPIQNNEGHEISAWRGTLVYDAKLPWGITQRLVLGANYRREKYFRDLFQLALTEEEIIRRGFAPGAARFFTNNYVYPVHYLKDGNSEEALRVRTTPGVTAFFRNTPASNQRFDQSLTSGSVTALGSYFKGRLRTTLGLSRDRWLQSANAAARTDPLTNEVRFVDNAGNFISADNVPLYPFATNWVTNQVYGGVFKVTPWLALTGTYQESSLFTDNFGTDLFGRPLKPRSGHGEDYGVRFTWGERLHASFVYFDNVNENVPLGALSAAVQTEIRGLVGPVLAGTIDTKDEASRGFEFEMTTNLTSNWTSSLNLSRFVVHPGNTYPQLKGLIADAQDIARSRGLDPETATATSLDLVRQADADAGAAGMVRVSIPRWTGSFVTRYRVSEGALRGLGIGTGVRYYSGKPRAPAIVDLVQVLPDGVTKQHLTVSPFVSYRRKVGRLTWTGQVNVNNISNRITDQGAQYRYPRYTEPRQYVYTLTAQF